MSRRPQVDDEPEEQEELSETLGGRFSARVGNLLSGLGSLGTVLGGVGAVGVALGTVFAIFFPELRSVGVTTLVVGLLLGLLALTISIRQQHTDAAGRRSRYGTERQ